MSQLSHRSSSTPLPNLKQLTSLLDLQLPPDETAPLYHDAIQLPSFLTHNLRDQNRKVKHLRSDHAILTAFYYSLMRLAFDLEDGKEAAIRTRRMLTGQEQFGAGELQDRTLSDRQYRLFLGEFMNILQQEGPFEQAIQPYPIIDTILLKMFTRIVPVTLLLRDADDQTVAHRVLSFLAGKFGLTLQSVGGCFKLVEPDIFVYVERLTDVYLVYVEELQGIKEEDEMDSEGIASRRESMNSMRKGDRASQLSLRSAVQEKRESEGMGKVDLSGISRESQRQKQRESGDAKRKNFQTVINILESNKSMGSRSNQDNRNSFQTGMGHNRIDSIKENLEQSVKDYYSPEPVSLSSAHKPSSSSILANKQHIQQAPVSSSSRHSQSSLGSEYSKMGIPSSPLCQSELSAYSSPSPSLSSPSPRSSDNFAKTYTPIPQEKPTSPSSKFSSQIYVGSKPSKLGIFSSVGMKPSPSGGAAYVGGWESEESVCDDSGYGKFTGKGVLQVLDEQFREEIKMIKKKYRHQRNSVKTFL